MNYLVKDSAILNGVPIGQKTGLRSCPNAPCTTGWAKIALEAEVSKKILKKLKPICHILKIDFLF